MRYALDLDALPIGAIVVAVDCWGENPTPFRVVERDTHHIVGRTSAGGAVFIGGPAVKRMARPDEAAAFAPVVAAPPLAPPSVPKASTQMELF